MASTKHEKASTKTQEAFEGRSVDGPSGKYGASASSYPSLSRGTNPYNTAVQNPTVAHFMPSSAPPRAPSPPPGYEESPFPLAAEANRDIEMQETRAPIPEHSQPKEFPGNYNYRYQGVVDTPRTKSFWHTRKGIIFVIMISNTIILCAVLGGVLGSMSARKSSSSNDNDTNHAAGGSGEVTKSQLYTTISLSTSTGLPPLPTPTSSPYTTSSPSVVPASTITATVTVAASTFTPPPEI